MNTGQRINFVLDLSTPKTFTYVAVKMATGNKVHLRKSESATTICNLFGAETDQRVTTDKIVTCKHCIKRMVFFPEAVAQGFTTEAK